MSHAFAKQTRFFLAVLVVLATGPLSHAGVPEPDDPAAMRRAVEAVESLEPATCEHPDSRSSDPPVQGLSTCGPWLRIAAPSGTSLISVTFSGERWVASSSGGYIIYSDDGTSWTRRWVGISKTLSSVRWFNSRFVVIGADGLIVSSPDGRSWTQHGSPTSSEMRALAVNGNVIVGVGRSGTIIRSTNGTNWTQVSSPTSLDLFAVTAFKGRFIATDADGRVLDSTDGLSWTVRTTLPSFPQFGSIMGMGANDSLVIAVGFDVSSSAPSKGILYYSSNGQTWTKVNAAPETLRGVAFGANKWVAVGDGIIMESQNGQTWNQVQNPLTNRIWEVVWGASQFIAVGWDGIVRSTCTVGNPPVANFTWSPHTPAPGQTVTFTDTSSGNPTSWSWVFSDGVQRTAQNPTRSFSTAGRYSATLTVTNQAGSHSVTKHIDVAAPSSYTYWIPVATHAAGAHNSQWRTDLGILNTENHRADVELRFHTTGGVRTSTTYVASGSQSILRDVVAQIGSSGSAALEVRSNHPIRVWSRTYNLVASGSSCYPNGTFGQSYPAVFPEQGLRAGETAYLGQLTENAQFRTNIALVNTGTSSATATVRLFDGAGNQVASYSVNLAPGTWRQENRPFSFRGNQTNMARGYARVTVNSGTGVFAFASVIDAITNDPTTIEAIR